MAATLDSAKLQDLSGTALDATCGHTDCSRKGHYFMPARCQNCGHECTMKLTKGHETPTFGKMCPKCECYTVKVKW